MPQRFFDTWAECGFDTGGHLRPLAVGQAASDEREMDWQPQALCHSGYFVKAYRDGRIVDVANVFVAPVILLGDSVCDDNLAAVGAWWVSVESNTAQAQAVFVELGHVGLVGARVCVPNAFGHARVHFALSVAAVDDDAVRDCKDIASHLFDCVHTCSFARLKPKSSLCRCRGAGAGRRFCRLVAQHDGCVA